MPEELDKKWILFGPGASIGETEDFRRDQSVIEDEPPVRDLGRLHGSLIVLLKHDRRGRRVVAGDAYMNVLEYTVFTRRTEAEEGGGQSTREGVKRRGRRGGWILEVISGQLA